MAPVFTPGAAATSGAAAPVRPASEPPRLRRRAVGQAVAWMLAGLAIFGWWIFSWLGQAIVRAWERDLERWYGRMPGDGRWWLAGDGHIHLLTGAVVGAWALLGAWRFGSTHPWCWPLSVAAVAIADELLQLAHGGGRAFEVSDLAWSLGGIAFGALVVASSRWQR